MIAENMRKNHMQNVDGTEGREGASEGESEGRRQAAGNTRPHQEPSRKDEGAGRFGDGEPPR